MSNDAQLDALIKKMAQDHQPELPSPGVIWWRAQIQKKLAEKERVERPMVMMRQLVAIIGAVAFLFLVVAHGRTDGAVFELFAAAAAILLIGVLAAAGLRASRA
ncbi:MAG TPA: hypothetical protein VFL42_14435 [Terriglobales bacterium]|nr:hypothetical protein [Terriglobales bacterium]